MTEDPTSDIRSIDHAVVAILVALVILWIFNVYILICMYRLINKLIRTTETKENIKSTEKTSRTSTPIPLLEKEEEERVNDDEIAVPVMTTNQIARRSMLLPELSCSSPDMPSNVYDEISNIFIPRKYLTTFANIRQGSRKRKRLGATTSGSGHQSTSKMLDAVSMTGGTMTSTTSDMISGLSFSMEESAKTPTTAFDGANFVTFRPAKKITEETTSETVVETKQERRQQKEGTVVERQTYINMGDVSTHSKSPLDIDDEDLADYIPMNSTFCDIRKLPKAVMKRPKPSPRSKNQLGFYISESPSWHSKEDDSTQATAPPGECHIPPNEQPNIFFGRDVPEVCPNGCDLTADLPPPDPSLLTDVV